MDPLTSRKTVVSADDAERKGMIIIIIQMLDEFFFLWSKLINSHFQERATEAVGVLDQLYFMMINWPGDVRLTPL